MPEGKQFLNPTPPDYSRDFVRPLCETENEFLQVLVTNFRIRKKGRGIELEFRWNSGDITLISIDIPITP